MNKLIMSTEKYEFCEVLSQMGFDITPSDSISNLLPFERRHADIQCLKINDIFFTAKECNRVSKELKRLGCRVIAAKKSISGKYPRNVLLNAVYLNDKLFCKKEALDSTVSEYCEQKNIKIINVNQGYTKCSTAVINNRFITADKGIFKAMTESGEEGELISEGFIDLDGVSYGFIGGCCFEDEKNVFFTGNVLEHPDYNKIKSVCGDKNIIGLTNKKLYDIGGFVLF